MSAAFDVGSLNEVFANATPKRNVDKWLEREDEFRKQNPDVVETLHKADLPVSVNLMRSAGPISDAYIFSPHVMSLIVGPGGSGKTTASAKKCAVECQRMRPGPDGVRRYVLGTWRQKYVNLWKATIPSWWKLFPPDLPGSSWTGSSPRDAQHIVQFEDKFGHCHMTNRFRAFGESADPEDVLGNEFTDVYLNEWTTFVEDLQIALADRIGRDPPREVSGRAGRMFGDANAPDVLHYLYRDFYETPREGYVLFPQPSGLAPDAENIKAVGREYYQNSVLINSHRPWWIKRMVHARPGFTRATDPAWPQFDDERHMAKATIAVNKNLEVVTGSDGGLTPATAYSQKGSDGQLRILAEIALERGGMRELADAMLELEASPRFEGCKFRSTCDPAMGAAEDTADGSDRKRLAKYLGRDVKLAKTNNADTRREAMRSHMRTSTPNGEPCLLIDPSCKGIRRGANQTFAYRRVHGTNDRGEIQKTFDSHICEAAEYNAMSSGAVLGYTREEEREKLKRARQEKTRAAGRYNPLDRRAS